MAEEATITHETTLAGGALPEGRVGIPVILPGTGPDDPTGEELQALVTELIEKEVRENDAMVTLGQIASLAQCLVLAERIRGDIALLATLVPPGIDDDLIPAEVAIWRLAYGVSASLEWARDNLDVHTFDSLLKAIDLNSHYDADTNMFVMGPGGDAMDTATFAAAIAKEQTDGQA